MKRNFKYGAASTVFIVVFLAVLIAVNLIVGLIGERANLLFDMTMDKRSSVSDTTYQILDSLEKEVKIYTFASPETLDQWFSTDFPIRFGMMPVNGFSLSEYMQKYALYSDKVEIEQLDFDADPTLREKYGLTSQSDIVVECGDRSKVVTFYDLFKVDANDNGDMYITGLSVEQMLTNAISYVVRDVGTKKHAYTVNHNENVGGEYINLLEIAGYESQTLDLMTGDIPEDVTYITVNTPAADFSQDEIKKLQLWLDRGDTTLAIYLYAGVENLSNLSSFLADIGIGVTSGITNVVVDQSQYVGEASAIITDYGSTQYTENLSDEVHLIMPWATPLELKETHDYKVSPVLYSAETSLLNDKSANGPFVIVAEAKKNATATGNSSKSKVIVSTASMALSDSYLSGAGINNAQFTLNCLNTGEDAPELTHIGTISFADNYLRMSYNEMRIFSYLFVYIIPVGLLALGLAVFIRRKHR